jgi:hypothetical protein
VPEPERVRVRARVRARERGSGGWRKGGNELSFLEGRGGQGPTAGVFRFYGLRSAGWHR